MSPVPVPEELWLVGYSGEFWMDAVIDDTIDVPTLRGRLPVLLGNGWAGVAIVDHPEGVALRCVRRDLDALWEALMRRSR